MPTLIFVNRFYHPDISATSEMLSGVARALAAEGHAVAVVTGRTRYDDARSRLPARERIDGVEVHRCASTGFGRANLAGRLLDYAGVYVTMSWRAARLARAGDWLIVKTDPPLLSIPLRVIARLRRARLANWLQDLFPEVLDAAGLALGPPHVHRLAMRALLAARDASLRASDANVVPGESMRCHLLARGLPPGRVTVVPNRADTALVRPLATTENPLRRAWGLEGRFVVGYSGNLGVAHDLALVVEAAARLADEPDVRFLIVGDGRRRRETLAAVCARGLDEKVLFRPYQPRERLRESLGAADLHLVSLRPEMEGLVVPSKFYGIAAAGRPTLHIGRADGDIPRTLARHRCGSCVDDGRAETLAATILAYARDPERCRAEGARARRLMLDEYDLEHVRRRWERVLAPPGPLPGPLPAASRHGGDGR